MNILLTDDALDWTDRQRRLLRVALATAARGHGVALVCASNALLSSEGNHAGLPVFHLPFVRQSAFESARQLRHFDRRAAIDVIHTHGLRDARACRLLHWTGTPVVRSCYDAEDLAGFLRRPRGFRGVVAAGRTTASALVAAGLKTTEVATLEDGEAFEAGIEALLALYARAAARQ